MPTDAQLTDTQNQWVICDYFADVAKTSQQTAASPLKLLSIGDQDYTGSGRSVTGKSWGGLHRRMIVVPFKQALASGEDQNGSAPYAGNEYSYETVLSRDSTGAIVGILGVYYLTGSESPIMPRHGGFRLHLTRDGEPVDLAERHWSAETLALSGLSAADVATERNETEFWLNNLVHPADRAELELRIKQGAREANGLRQHLAYRSTTEHGPKRRYRPCALSAYGQPVAADPKVTLIRGFWRQLRSSAATRVTGLTELTDAEMLPGTHAAVESFLTFAYVHTDRNEILATSANWSAWGFPAADSRTPFLDLVHPEDRAAVRAMMAVAITDSAPAFPVRFVGGRSFTAHIVAGASMPDRVLTVALRKDDDASSR